MNRVRHQFLAGSTLAVDQHAAVGGGHQSELLAQSLHWNAFTDDLVARAAFSLKRSTSRSRRRCCRAFFTTTDHFLDGERLLNEVERAELGRFDCRLDGPVAGNNHHHGTIRERDFL